MNMQNIDFYNGNHHDYNSSKVESPDPEYFSRVTNLNHRDEIRNQKKASRLISFIIGLCIISFTTGLIVGIKFAAGNNKEIVDAQTKKTVSSLSNKVSSLINKENSLKNNITDANKIFPKHSYPFVIRIGNEYSKRQSKDIANFLSTKGHTIFIAKNNDNYRVYTGPYKTKINANSSLKRINQYSSNLWYENALVIKR